MHRNLRPERPDEEDAPQLTDAVWALAKKCWAKDPDHRPSASALCDIVRHLLDTIIISESTPADLPPPPTTAQDNIQHSPTLSPTLTIRGHTDKVYCAAFSPDGKYIISGCADHTIRVWNVQTGNPSLQFLAKHDAWIDCVAFSPNGRRIVAGCGDGTVLVLHAITGTTVAGPFKGHTDAIWSVCFSPDGKQIASGSNDMTIRVWDAHTGTRVVGPLNGHTGNVNAVAFSGDGKRIVSGSYDKTVRIWDAKSGKLVQGPLGGHKTWVSFVGFSPDAKKIVSLSFGGDVCVWDVDSATVLSKRSRQHAEGSLVVNFVSNSSSCAVSPDGKWTATCTGNDRRTVQVRDSMTGLPAATFGTHIGMVETITFSPDSKRVLSSSYDKTIRVHTLDC